MGPVKRKQKWAKEGARHIFNDLEMKAEMLALRMEGYSFKDISRKYGVDHTTIIHHCRKAGLLIFEDPAKKEEMFSMMRKTKNVDKVALFYGVPRTVIKYHCAIAGVIAAREGIGSESSRLRLHSSPEKVVEVTPFHSEPIVDEPVQQVRPGFRLDERGEWICVGQTVGERKQAELLRKQRKAEQIRIALLVY